MLKVKTSIKPSPINNVGCFLEEPVKKGQVIWEFDTTFDILLSPVEYEALDRRQKEFVDHYGYLDKLQFKGYYVIHSGNDRFMNHSDNPNTIGTEDAGLSHKMIAAMDMTAGTELTCNYFDYSDKI